jgi:hypothetical protein
LAPSDWASVSSAVFAGISALIAAAAIYFPARTLASQNILDQAQLSLERAYQALTSDGTQLCPPAPDRLNWLTTARHLQAFKGLKAKLKSEVHRTICEEQEEYWRHRFYLCLRSNELQQPSYYMESLGPNPKDPIDKRSALVVHAFAKWPDGRPDPIDKVDTTELIEKGRALEGNPGLRSYLEQISGNR